MRQMDRLSIRMPDELMDAAKELAAAEGISVGLWARRLIEKATGVKVHVVRGLGSTRIDEAAKQRVRRAGVKAIRQKAKEHSVDGVKALKKKAKERAE